MNTILRLMSALGAVVILLAGVGGVTMSSNEQGKAAIGLIPQGTRVIINAPAFRMDLFEGFVRYLAVRIADQQQVIANLVTVDSEQRLGQTLLQLARTMGKKDPRSIRIELKITHEELSEMVGATRSRISLFMQRFHNLGLIEANADHFLIIKEKKLTDYLAQIA